MWAHNYFNYEVSIHVYKLPTDCIFPFSPTELVKYNYSSMAIVPYYDSSSYIYNFIYSKLITLVVWISMQKASQAIIQALLYAC